ncbi:MAG: bifunctional metallophosphatase/5'-nucleotidase [Bacilli bacterium]|nr:bifunctional metallophosphatase/5'-nucleotidase [Bacilli bacterium]
MEKNIDVTINHKKRNQVLILIGSALALSAIVATSTYFIAKHLSSQSKDITILYTNDVHGRFGGSISYKNVSKMKKDLQSAGRDVLLVDSGDHLSGSLYAVYDEGYTVKGLMGEAQYDVCALGNHEFDYNFPRLNELISSAKYSYICSNLYHMENGVPTTRFIEPSKIFNIANTKIGFIGVTTPSTIGDASPAYFKDDDGNYIYTFLAGNNGQDLYDNVQEEVNNLKRQGCRYVIALSHLGDDEKTKYSDPFSSTSLAMNTNNIDAIIDGHSHQTITHDIAKNKDGKDVVITQTGSYFNHIGCLTISPSGEISTSLIDSYGGEDPLMAEQEKAYIDIINKEFDTEVAECEFKFTKRSDGDHNYAELCADSFYYAGTNPERVGGEENVCDCAFVNNGGIRLNSVNPGKWTKKTCYETFSFNNHLVIREVKGDTLKKALEYSVRNLPNYTSGFLIPCGLKYTIDETVTSNIETDDNGNYRSGPTAGGERIKDLKVFNRGKDIWEDFDVNKRYKIAGADYIFEAGGDGLSMFDDEFPGTENVTLYKDDETIADYTILEDYIKSFDKKGGELPVIDQGNTPLVKHKFGTWYINYNYQYLLKHRISYTTEN